MPWTGPNFIRHNEDYSGATVWQSDRDASILIMAVRHDYHDQDMAQGVDACINKNGANSPTANINWGGFKITNLGAGSAATDSATYGQTITAASLDAGTNILTLTRTTGGNVTVDLSALAVGGSTSDFARYSNLTNPFVGSATFGSTLQAKPSLTLVDTGESVLAWVLQANSRTNFTLTGLDGAQYRFVGNSGSAFLQVNGSNVWTEASLPASTFTGLLRSTDNATVTGAWTFTNPSLKLVPFQWSSAVGGGNWNVGPATATQLNFTDPGGLSGMVYTIDGSFPAGAYLTIGPSGKKVWDEGSLKIVASGVPTGGNDNNIAIVQTGGSKGVWCKISGTWMLIAS